MTSNNRLSGKPARAAMAALLLCAVFTAAQAQQLYEPPATEGTAVLIPSLSDQDREEQAAARALAERRQTMIDDCEQNFGSEMDCTREVDTELRAEGLQSGARVIHLRPAR
jgi:hypothetical protein